MTSKNELELLKVYANESVEDEEEVYNIEHAYNNINIAYNKVLQDLDRLEKLEKAFKIIWKELDLYMVALEKEYELRATWCSSNISKEKGRLLREVLEDDKD